MNRRLIIKVSLLVLTGSVLFFSNSASAALVPCGGPNQDPCDLCHLFMMFGLIADFIMKKIVPAVAVLMLIIVGINFFTAMGNPGKLDRAKKMIFSIFAGLLIVILAWSIVVAFYKILGANVDPKGWWDVCP